MKEQLILTILADDRPGLVESISERISEHGGSWLESSMARLSGKFAGILRIEVTPERRQDLRQALDQLQAQGMRIQIETTTPTEQSENYETFHLELVGQDRPGIVRTLATTLSQFRVNVESLETERGSAPMSGEMLFQARAELRIPTDTDRNALQMELEKIAADLLVDLDLKPSES
jgi:glycine cleavage system regulatory protein